MKLVFKNVYYSNNNKLLIDNLSFFASEHEFTSILSNNHDVTNTLVKLIIGVEKVKSGSIYLDDRDITYLKPEHRNISLITSSPYLKEELTVFDNVAYPLYKKKLKMDEVEKKVDEILKILSIDYLSGISIMLLSDYQKILVSLARGIVNNPNILIFLDPLEFDNDRQNDFISSIKKVHEYLNKPVVLYFNKYIKLSNKIITINDNGKHIETVRKGLFEYSINCKTLDLIKDPNRVESINEEINQECSFIPARIEGNILYYNNESVNLNKIYMNRFLVEKEVKYIKVFNNRLTSYDYGGSLKLKILDKMIDNKVVHIKLEGINVVRLLSDIDFEQQYLYYSLDNLYFYDSNYNILNTLTNKIDNIIPSKIISNKIINRNVSKEYRDIQLVLRSNKSKIILSKEKKYNLSLDKKEGIFISKILTFEEFETFYYINCNLESLDNIFQFKVSKSLNPLLFDKTYLKIEMKNILLNKYL